MMVLMVWRRLPHRRRSRTLVHLSLSVTGSLPPESETSGRAAYDSVGIFAPFVDINGVGSRSAVIVQVQTGETAATEIARRALTVGPADVASWRAGRAPVAAHDTTPSHHPCGTETPDPAWLPGCFAPGPAFEPCSAVRGEAEQAPRFRTPLGTQCDRYPQADNANREHPGLSTSRNLLLVRSLALKLSGPVLRLTWTQ